MNIKLLKAFIIVADEGSFSKAAERLYLSQPALSQNIKQLETHFNTALINRTPHSFSLTEAGTVLYQHAIEVLKRCDVMEENMNVFHSSVDDTLSVGATTVIGGYAVPCSIFIFKRKRPDSIIKLKLGNRREILDFLREDIIDIAIIEGAKPDDHFNSTEIHIEEMVIVAPNTQQWEGCKNLCIEDFCKLPLIMREEGSATRWAIDRTLLKADISLQNLNIIMELNSINSIKAAVEAGHGISILPRVAVKKELYNKALLPLHIDQLVFSQPIYIVSKRKQHRMVATEFIKLMKSPANGFC